MFGPRVSVPRTKPEGLQFSTLMDFPIMFFRMEIRDVCGRKGRFWA
jgi:hypothetical protein